MALQHRLVADLPDLQGARILVVEDHYLLADEIRRMLLRLGAEVAGPVPDVARGLDLVAGGRLDGAVLDVNLDGEDVYPIAEELTRQGVPFVFLTGYERWVLPPAYESVERLDKPFAARELAQALHRIVRRRADSAAKP